MLIYLDANLIQYCADYEEFILGDKTTAPTSEQSLLRELTALRELVELEQLGSQGRTRPEPHCIGIVHQVHVARPSECIGDILSGLFLR